MVMVKMTILTMATISFLSSIYGHGRMVKISRYFNYFNKVQTFQLLKIWNCGDGHDQIWTDHFDHENF
jgi:hypothetical protein